MIKLYYDDILVAELINSGRNLTVDEALELIEFNEEKFIAENGFDDIDYNDFRIVR